MIRLLPLFVAIAAIASTGLAKAPNILLILVDDMGYGDVGAYNDESKIPTPYLDKLAHDGMMFTDAHAAGSLCHPSRYGLITGELPTRVDTSVWSGKAVIAEDRMTLASLLKGQGYRTAMVGKWHLGFNEDGFDQPMPGGPIDVGFDTYFGIRASTDIPPYFYIEGDRALVPPIDHIEARGSGEPWTRIQGEFSREGGVAPNLQLEHVLSRFTDEAVGVIRNHARLEAEKPLFLYLAYPAPHTPWLPSPAFRGVTNNMYGDFTAMVDHMIGRVLTALEQSGMREETLVIFSSDNGPVWYDKDTEQFGHDALGGMQGMKGDAYEGGHRMPFIVRWPGAVEASSASDQTICFTDVMATLAGVTGANLPKGQAPDSFSFLPALQGNSAANTDARGPLVLESARGHYALRHGKWKYINGLGSGGFSDGFSSEYRARKPGPNDPTAQLFDMEADPGETTNLWSKHPDLVKKMSTQLERLRTESHTRPY
ncbi:MAG: arylsulfatase [Opitutaceae bacterium]|tara:strand:- start:7420 stop:8868 length:1449 start_codon:yes stop_codon:yes gene_type:complete